MDSPLDHASLPRHRAAVSWLVVVLGMLLGLCGLVMSAQEWLDPDPGSSVWLTSRMQAVGPGLLGLVFLAGSFAALHSRRRAGLIFLAGAPFVAFVLSYPGAGYLIWSPDGSGIFYLPLLPTAAELTCVFYLPLVAPLLVLRHRKRAFWVFLIATALAALVFFISRWTVALLPRLAGWTALFLAFGGFWLGTGKKCWRAMMVRQSRPAAVRLAIVLAECLGVAALVVTGTLVATAIRSSLWSADCSGPSLFLHPIRPGHIALTARVVWTGHSARVSGKWAGGWAVGLVQERFWGLPSWAPDVVLLTNHLFWEGETFFVSGVREESLSGRFLPIVDARPCGSLYAQPVTGAKIHLDLLRHPPPDGELRITGYVWSPLPFEEARPPTSDSPVHKPMGGVRIRATSSSMTKVVTTDRDGLYVFAGLQPDDYTLRVLDLPDNVAIEDRSLKKEDLVELGRARMDIYVEWRKP